MRHRGLRLDVRRYLAPLVVATLLAAAIGVAPEAVSPARAGESPLRVAADATYTLDPEAGRVHVAVRFRATNLQAPTSTTIFFYRDLAFAIQPEARAVRASDGAGDLSVTTRQREAFVRAEVHLRANLFYQESTTFTIRYDLIGGAPRSDSPIRVGRAFATFGVWAWGDVGRSTVEVHTPKGFGSQIDGEEMRILNAVSGQTLVAEPADPNTFYSIVNAENRSAYGSSRLSLPGGVEVVVLAWPEDDAWERTVSETLEVGLPVLLELIGLDWPVDHDLNVRERYTPALEGYAGIFFIADQRIDISEDLDPSLIMHEASHAWFNDALFADRWVYEGLAEEYAWRVQTQVGGDAGSAAEKPAGDDPGYVPLNSWFFPEVIRDQETDDRERFGYEAAFWVVHQVVLSAGVAQMREAFANAEANLTAYPGATEPESVAPRDSWKRFLDLTQPIDQPDQIDLDKAVLELVIAAGDDVEEYDDRLLARELYRSLLDAGDDWQPPWYVRKPMGEWEFNTATDRIREALTIVALRDEVDAAAVAQGLEPDDALRAAFEEPAEGFGAATEIAEGQLEALAAIADAQAQVAIEPDLLGQVGLLGETPPRTPYQAARDSFERGELDAAVSSAVAAVAIVTGAAATGQQRLLIAAAFALAVLLLLVMLLVALRRRRRRRVLAFALAPALAAPDASAPTPAAPAPEPDLAEPALTAPTPGPDLAEPYATLAADPAPQSPPATSPPDLEGDERA